MTPRRRRNGNGATVDTVVRNVPAANVHLNIPVFALWAGTLQRASRFQPGGMLLLNANIFPAF